MYKKIECTYHQTQIKFNYGWLHLSQLSPSQVNGKGKGNKYLVVAAFLF